MKQEIKKINLGERMYGYESVTKNKLMPKQPAIIKVKLRHYDKFLKSYVDKENLNAFDSFQTLLLKAIGNTTKTICEEVSNVVLAYHFKDEILFVIRDDIKQEHEQYFKGDIQEIVSMITSKFTYYFNNNLITILDIDLLHYTPAFFNASCYNLPIFEIVNNLIFKQRESRKFYAETNYDNGFIHYKIDVADLNNHDSKVYNKWTFNTKPPIFSKNKSFIEKHLK